jgi:integrase
MPRVEMVRLVGKQEADAFSVEDIATGRRLAPLPRRFSFTEARLHNLPFQERGQRLHADADIRHGFYVCVGRSTKSFVVQREINGSCNRIVIGRHPEITVDDARQRANRCLADMKDGTNPRKVEKEKQREEEAKRVTLNELWALFQHRMRNGKPLKANTRYQYGKLMEDVFREWRDASIAGITPEAVVELYEKTQKRGKAYANQAMRFLRAMLNLTDAKGDPVVEKNPVRALKNRWVKIDPRNCIIESRHLHKWFRALAKVAKEKDIPTAAVGTDYLEFVLLTGVRRNEAARLTWNRVNFDEKLVTFVDTKNGGDHVLPLTSHLLLLLKRRRAANRKCRWVFPACGRKRGEEGHLTEPRFIAQRVTEVCGVQFTIHDLRRTFVSAANALGFTDYTIKRLVNHTPSRNDVTERHYIRVEMDHLRQYMQRITDHFLSFKAAGQGLKLAGTA